MPDITDASNGNKESHSSASSKSITGRIPCLDGLRALAITLVVLGHLSAQHRWQFPRIGVGVYQLPLNKAIPITGGHLGVTVFFVISGFLITALLLREQARTGTISLRDFYTRRALRIFPAYFAFLGAIFLLVSLGLIHFAGRYWVAALTYTMSFMPLKGVFPITHLWSLSVEEHFYLIWPCALLFLGARRATNVILVYLAATPAIRYLIATRFPNVLDINFCSLTQMSSIAIGCLLAFVASGQAFPALARWIRQKPTLTFSLSMVVLELSYLALKNPYYLVLFGDPVNALAVAVGLGALLNMQGSLLFRLLNLKPVVWLGVLSYSVYLWQQILIVPGSFTERLPWPVQMVLILAVATASYFLIETPFLRLKERRTQAIADRKAAKASGLKDRSEPLAQEASRA